MQNEDETCSAYKGLAMLMRGLHRGLETAKQELEQKIARLAKNLPQKFKKYERARAVGFDYMDAKTIPQDTTVAERLQLKNLIEDSKFQDNVECVETVATGLLILLVPAFLRIALSYTRDVLPDNHPMLYPRSLHPNIRDMYEEMFTTADQSTHNTAYMELFKVLSGKDNGPWNLKLNKGNNLSLLHRDGLKRCKAAGSRNPEDYVLVPEHFRRDFIDDHYQGYLPESFSDVLGSC